MPPSMERFFWRCVTLVAGAALFMAVPSTVRAAGEVFGVLVSDASLTASSALMFNDADGDSLSDYDETYVYHTNPEAADTDGDGYNDAQEIRNGFSPHQLNQRLAMTDFDGDGLSDEMELALKTDLGRKDSDSDGVDDRDEVFGGRDPLSATSTTSTVKRFAHVDLNRQQLTYFFNGIKLGTMPVSTGKPQTPTPVGSFQIMRKLPVHHYVGPGYNLPNTKWNLEFKRSYYLHGAYWHNQFGIRTMSHGCVNMAYRDVEKLYAFLQVGDTVQVTGKTSAARVSNPITLPTTQEIKKAVQQIAKQPGDGS